MKRVYLAFRYVPRRVYPGVICLPLMQLYRVAVDDLYTCYMMYKLCYFLYVLLFAHLLLHRTSSKIYLHDCVTQLSPTTNKQLLSCTSHNTLHLNSCIVSLLLLFGSVTGLLNYVCGGLEEIIIGLVRLPHYFHVSVLCVLAQCLLH